MKPIKISEALSNPELVELNSEDVDGRRFVPKRLLLLVVVLLVVVVGGYFAYASYENTPARIAEKAFAAVKAGDYGTLADTADLPSIITGCYRDLTRDLFAYDTTLTNDEKIIFETFYQKIEPEVVGGTAPLLETYLTSGSWQEPSGESLLKGRSLGVDYELLVEKSRLRDLELVALGEVVEADGRYTVSAEVRDTVTDTPYTLVFGYTRVDGEYKIAAIDNYKAMLDILTPIYKSEVNSYLGTTAAIVSKYNRTLEQEEQEFELLTRSKSGTLSDRQRIRIASYIRGTLVKTLTERQKELDTVPVPVAARYLANLRKASTDLAVKSWQEYAKGLEENDPAAIHTSRAIHKDEIDIENRISDYIRGTAFQKVEENP